VKANPLLKRRLERPIASLLAASLAFPAVAVPSQAFALPPPPPPPPPVVVVQPVPVQPVPYAPPPAVPAGSSAAAGVEVLPALPPGQAVDVPRLAQVGTDIVYLKGGGMLRGTLIEAIPNDHATLEMATGQTAVIPWDRIERIERAGSRPPTPAPSFTPAFPAPPEGNALVHIDSEDPVTLERRVPGTRFWTPVCTSPCDIGVPVWGSYRISGQGIRDSNDFNLAARNGDHVVLNVSSATKGGFAGGIALTSIGGFSILVGATILFSVATSDLANNAADQPSSPNDGTWNTAGWIMVGAGAGAVLVGILLLTTNRHSNVAQSGGLTRQASEGTDALRADARFRAPQWHDDKTAQGLPKAVGAPILKFSF